jgi:hypothetical protein
MIKTISLLVPILFIGSVPIQSGIHKIDFLNFDYPFKSHRGPFAKFSNTINVREGKAYSGKEGNSLSYLYFKVVEIVYGDLTRDGLEEAAVVAIYGTGSGNFYLTNIYFYSLHNDKPVLIAMLTEEDVSRDYTQQYRSEGSSIMESIGGGRKIKDGIFITKHFADGAHCCPTSIAALQYRLSGSRMELMRIQKRKLRANYERIKESYDK